MNVLDIVILVLFIPGVIRGLTKGFVEQAVTLVGVIFSIWLAGKYAASLCVELERYIPWEHAVVQVIAFVLIVIAGMLVIMIIAGILNKITKMANLSWFNKLLGLVLSVAVTSIVVSLIIILFDTINVKFGLVNSPVLDESLLYGTFKEFGYTVFPYLKQLVSTITSAGAAASPETV